MNDRELLQAAGRAADIAVEFLPAWGGGIECRGNGHYWNPLTNSADALALAVNFCLPVDITDEETVRGNSSSTWGRRFSGYQARYCLGGSGHGEKNS